MQAGRRSRSCRLEAVHDRPRFDTECADFVASVVGMSAGRQPRTMASVSTPRPAATVVLLRHGPDGLEVLLTHRPASMAFAPDVHVFPGGRVDAADADPGLLARCVTTADDAAAALGGDLAPDEALAAYVAAIREAFEEVGILLADHAAPGSTWPARAIGCWHRPTRSASIADELDLTAADRPARPAVALGHATDPRAPVRCPLLRGDGARRRGGVAGRRGGGGPRLASTARRARVDGSRRARHVAADVDDAGAAPARHVDRGDPVAAGPGSSRRDRRRGRRR